MDPYPVHLDVERLEMGEKNNKFGIDEHRFIILIHSDIFFFHAYENTGLPLENIQGLKQKKNSHLLPFTFK